MDNIEVETKTEEQKLLKKKIITQRQLDHLEKIRLLKRIKQLNKKDNNNKQLSDDDDDEENEIEQSKPKEEVKYFLF